jgi:hypothetical protein
MSVIDGIGAPAPSRPSAAARKTAPGAAFALPAAEAKEAAPAAAPAASPVGLAGLQGLDGLLAMLEDTPAPAERDRRARAHGSALLAALAALQHDLLGDAPQGSSALDRLDVLLAHIPEAADPALAAAIAAVALRARIERLRRTHGPC